MKAVFKRLVRIILLLLATLFVGTACHEFIGHGGVGVLCGGRVTRVEVMGLQLYPTFTLLGWQDLGHYGSCSVYGITYGSGHYLMAIGGSMSTWCVSVIAVAIFWCRPWRGWRRTLLIYVGIWWLDLLTYTLPIWGIRKSIVWGEYTGFSEPFEAALALGIQSWIYQIFVLTSSIVLAVALILRIRMTAEKSQQVDDGPSPTRTPVQDPALCE